MDPWPRFQVSRYCWDKSLSSPIIDWDFRQQTPGKVTENEVRMSIQDLGLRKCFARMVHYGKKINISEIVIYCSYII